jgi:hypothetical protein
MYKFWDSIIQPLFDRIRPGEIVEIGADHGFNTRNILAYCRQTDSHAHIIDPLPKFDPDAMKNEYGDVFTFYRALSLNALPLIGHMDVALIDGDHNWYTVYHELKLIEKKIPATDPVFPLIIVHDVSWPYARRDLYYAPENIPVEHRMPYLRKGIDPEGGGLADTGGLNPHLYNAVEEGIPRSGVLTAIEDFIKESGRPFELVNIPVFHGLGILYTAHLKTTNPSFGEFIRALTLSSALSKLFSDVEKTRIKTILAHEEANQKLMAQEKTRQQESEEQQQALRKAGQQLESLEKKVVFKDAQLKTLGEKKEHEARQWKAEIESAKIKLRELEDRRRSERDYYKQQIEEHHQKIKRITETNARMISQRDQLSEWIKQLRFQFEALVQSKRWKLGNALVGMATLSKFKKNFSMASDHMMRIFQKYDAEMNENALDIVFFWKQNDTGIYGRRSDMLIKYLSRRPQIRRIIVFDMPIAIDVLREKSKNKGLTHDQNVYRETLLRNMGVRNSEKVSFHTFVYGPDNTDSGLQNGRYPDLSEYMHFIEDRLKESDIKPNRAVFWFYPLNSNIPKIVKQFKPRIKVIDLVDDHRTWSEMSMIKRIYITRHYRDVLKIGDLVFANCFNIRQSMQRYHPDIKLIPNGCELEPPPDLSDDSVFQEFKETPGFKIGYVGNLEKDKIDVDLIQYMAEKRPAWNIILIGSTHANPQILKLKKFSNVHFMGVIEYPDVRAWIQEMDVAILPHLNSKKTRSMNPLKLYVYCSLGVPVVSTDIENLDELKPFVWIADTYDDFILKVEKALEDGKKEISNSLNECLIANTWEKRVDQILKELLVSVQ